MQKKLLALAIAGAMAAPLAAQAQGSNVTIYGSLKPSIDFIDDGEDSGQSVQSNNSLIGFKGSEDLGNGLKAIFQLESQLNFDDRGDTSIANDEGQWVRRDSWLGLEGGFGSLVIGNMFAPYKRSTDFADPFADSIGDYNNIVGTAFSGEDDFNLRIKNAVYYASPNFSGFQITALYGLHTDTADSDQFESDDDDPDNDTFSVAITYAAGPFNFSLAHEDKGTANAAGDDRKATKVGVGYKFGNTTLAALYADEEFNRSGLDERDVWFVSIRHVMGKITLGASYTQADDYDSLDDTGAKAFAVGATYAFSKRTSIMGLYSKVDNDDNAFYGFDSGYSPFDTGESVSGFSVRLRHDF